RGGLRAGVVHCGQHAGAAGQGRRQLPERRRRGRRPAARGGRKVTTSTDTGKLLSDLKTTTAAVQNKDWCSAGLGGVSVGLDILTTKSSPLSGLASAGLGFVTPLISFLEEPLKQLSGEPSSVSTGTQGFTSAGKNVSSLADSYQDASKSETSNWSGAGASEYRNAGSQLADGISAV